MLNILPRDSHKLFFAEFDVRLLDRSCAAVVFWHLGLSGTFLMAMDSRGKGCESLDICMLSNSSLSKDKGKPPKNTSQPNILSLQIGVQGDQNSANTRLPGYMHAKQFNVPNECQPNISRSSSFQIGVQGDQNGANTRLPGYMHVKQFNVPNESSGSYNHDVPFIVPSSKFTQGNADLSWTNSNNLQSTYHQNHYLQPVMSNNIPLRPACAPPEQWTHASQSMSLRPNGPSFTSGPPPNMPDVSKLSVSGYSPNDYNPNYTSQSRNGEEMKQSYLFESSNYVSSNNLQRGHTVHNRPPPLYQETSIYRHSNGPELLPLSSSVAVPCNISMNGV